MEKRIVIKNNFASQLSGFADSLGEKITQDGEWTIKGFIDVFKNIRTISADTKIISKILELHLFPHFQSFAYENGYAIETATHQNWYPDLTFIRIDNPSIKFAVDIKITYRKESNNSLCNGFTLGSHGEYFCNRESAKNIQYPYGQYLGHFCLGIIYSRKLLSTENEMKLYGLSNLTEIPSVINHFIFFAQEKWKIASDKSGSGNTANIGSIKCIEDIINGRGVFCKVGEDIFDDYWRNYGKIKTTKKDGKIGNISSLSEYLRYRGMCESISSIDEEGQDEE